MRGYAWAATSLAAVANLTLGQRAVDFSRDIAPIFQGKCLACHGPAQQMNGLRFDDGEAALRGAYSGPVIVPGKSRESKLIQRVSSGDKATRMPPAGEPLTAGQIASLKAWIDSGAPWPAAAKKAPPPRATHWSFQAIRKPDLPAVQNRAWIRNPVDTFVLARLESEGLAPSPEADRATLLRRVKLDLTGLPPTPAEVSEFLSDNRSDAYERLVDRFLASPHYGERWARPWLDLAHYADSDGYEKDNVRPHAWRYRQWVIDALNSDMPFDRFTVEQIAGDQLPSATVEQRVATGFFRNTLTNREAGVDRAEARFEQLVDRTNTLGTVWLGLTVRCAQCHDHKYDPITQRDYYQLLAFFNSADDADIDAPAPGEMGPYLRALPDYTRKRAALERDHEIAGHQARWEEKILAAMNKPGVDLEFDFAVTSMRAMLDHAERILRTSPGNRTPQQADRLMRYFISNPGPELGKDPAAATCIKDFRARLAELDRGFPFLTQAMVLSDHPDPPETRIAVRGDFRNQGVPVRPAAPAALPQFEAHAKSPRLSLARWLVSPENPLTARVAVNRLWQEFFGRGLVLTSEDFGAQGERPSHPELLDWLAAEFREGGWGLKRMHRLIVTSAAYRQSSKTREELREKDPNNTLVARQSRLRLPAELIRDAALEAGGILNPAIGGKSVRPPMPAGVAELGYANSVKWVESQGMDRYRRGLYIHFQRTTPYPQLMNFDEPDSNVACSRRRASNTPLQALNLLNDPVFAEAARGLATRGIGEARGGVGERLDYLYRLALGRSPAAAERERLRKFIDAQTTILVREGKHGEELELAAWTGVSRVLLNLDEFITRE